MLRWRVGASVFVLAVVGLPTVWPFVWLAADPGALARAVAPGRLLTLTATSAALLTGTLALALPLGLALAVLTARTNLPGRAALRAVLAVAPFVPLPLLVAGWQPALDGGPLFGRGMWQTVFLHGIAAIPWVVMLVGEGLRRVERDAEESALLDAAPWAVVWRVSLPASGLAIAAATWWVVVQTAAEITITDVYQVRTLAEEVYTQLTAPEVGRENALAGAAAVALLGVVPLSVLGVWLAEWLTADLAGPEDSTPPHVFALGRWRAPAAGLAWGAGLLLAGFPVAGLVARAGLDGAGWSFTAFARQLGLSLASDGRTVLESVAVAGLSGAVCAAGGLVLAWTCLGAPRYRRAVFALLAVAWVMPGPLVGLAFKQLLPAILTATGDPPWLARWLWYGPSYLPLVWVHVVRFLPLAVALAWAALRQMPTGWRDLAAVDGATPWQELRYLVWPSCRATCAAAALAVAALALGELAAGKLVATPGAPAYAAEVFAQLHYGFTPSLAGQCLLLLAAVLACVGALWWLVRRGGA